MGLRSLLFPALLMLAGCTGPYSEPTVAAKNEGKPVPVRVRTASLESIPEIISATGELSAEDIATISAKVPGRVEKLLVDLGSVVEQGQVLAELEQDDYTFRVRQAEALVDQTRARLGLSSGSDDKVDPVNTATVRQAAAGLKEARLLHANSTQLFRQGVVSNVDFQRAGVALQAAEARYQAAIEDVYQSQAQLLERRAAVSLARQQLSDTVIRAPFHGAITRRQATVGEFLAVNAPVVMLVRQSPLRLRLEIPERLAVKVRPGQRIDVRLEGSTVTHTGAVVRISPSLEAQNRSLLIEGRIPNEDNMLRAGSFAQGIVTVDPNARGITVPVNSVLNFAGVDRVLVVENKAVAERIVRLGRRLEGDRFEIVSGVKPGDLVIADPSDRLSAGQPVEVSPK
ncbi:MAG TPA: efflux RND transporter periplasmic adaptor subunit [Bryobacteraceae bacterium]|nr:efflux RND transporter periplasmic adaptor subunit [Bryobacteraceae bacterium]